MTVITIGTQDGALTERVYDVLGATDHKALATEFADANGARAPDFSNPFMQAAAPT